MGSLKETLDRFNKQQEKCQSTLTSIAASRAGAMRGTPPKPAAPMAPIAKSVVPAVKFSSDTVRLQHINNIRKAPTAAQIKRVIALLYESRKAYTPEQINQACYVDALANKEVFDRLKNNLKLHYDGKRFSYKAKHAIENKDQLFKLILTCDKGIAIIDLKDSYPTVMDDLQALRTEGKIWLLSNFDSQEDIAYPNDPKINIKVDDDLKLVFRKMELPRDMLDIERDLQKNGMKPSTNTAKRRAAAQMLGIPQKPKTKKKKNEIGKRTKLTNRHLPELFKQ